MNPNPHHRWQSCCSSRPNTQAEPPFHTRLRGPLWPGQHLLLWFQTGAGPQWPHPKPHHNPTLPILHPLKDATEPHFKPPPPPAPQQSPRDTFPVKHRGGPAQRPLPGRKKRPSPGWAEDAKTICYSDKGFSNFGGELCTPGGAVECSWDPQTGRGPGSRI